MSVSPILLWPTAPGVGVYSLQQGLQYALQQQGYKVALFNPLADVDLERAAVEHYLLNDDIKTVMESVLSAFERRQQQAEVVIVEGLFMRPTYSPEAWMNPYIEPFNQTLMRALNAYVVIVTTQGQYSLDEINEQLSFQKRSVPNPYLLGAVITKLNAPVRDNGELYFTLLDEPVTSAIEYIAPEEIENLPVFRQQGMHLLGVTEWQKTLAHPRVLDIQRLLNLTVLVQGEMDLRRVSRITMCARSLDRCFDEMTPGTLIMTSADRTDVIAAACLAAQKGVRLAGVLLTAHSFLAQAAKDFCFDMAQACGLPILTTENKSIHTVLGLSGIDYTGIPNDDTERWQALKEQIASCIDTKRVTSHLATSASNKMSPPAFRYHLLKLARSNRKRIVLPEGNDPRILEAATLCHQRQIADCVLLGDQEEIEKIAARNGLTLPESLEIQSPFQDFDQHLATLLEVRKSKGLSEVMAREALQKNPIFVGTLMLYNNTVDGLVAGAAHTTADTIRPALQIIKTKPQCQIVSSIFFMCLEDQVLVYGDCAVNQNPNAEQLAEIATESAISAQRFGIDPKVAMISYSTGNSGSGQEVEKVKHATDLIQQRKPAWPVDGPLQYDAAMIESVAHKKAPNSVVAGQATVLVFPDLNTGNTVYKAVQRSANVLSIGPVLQGLNKPVNDLSRGATVDDIVYTIAITAIQSQ